MELLLMCELSRLGPFGDSLLPLTLLCGLARSCISIDLAGKQTHTGPHGRSEGIHFHRTDTHIHTHTHTHTLKGRKTNAYGKLKNFISSPFSFKKSIFKTYFKML